MSDSSSPFYFGSSARPLFGWLHGPVAGPAKRVGLLICSPLGYEYLCAHRTIKHFAKVAASQGLPALRFDYDGTGDSAGSDLDAGRLKAWTSSTHVAIDELKARTGVHRVCILGVRLGATLAALVAAERDDVLGIAAIAPVAKVRKYLRELRALALSRASEERPSELDIQESAGFVLTSAAREELDGIDLAKLARVPRELLVIERHDLPTDGEWLRHAAMLGANVEHQRLPGYAEMMLDSHEARVPHEMLQSAMQWLDRITTDSERVSHVPADLPSAIELTVDGERISRIVEKAGYIDETQTVFGILTAPHEPVSMAAGSAVLLLNSGAVHHVGPNRMYVNLARRWAAAGAIVLRLDLSGLGDSSVHAGEAENIVYGRRALQDVDAAIAFLNTYYGGRDIHVMGLCSGAYHGFKSAVAGARLKSVVAINPLTFAWREGTSLAFPEYRIAADVMRYRTNAFRWASWKKLLRGGVNVVELLEVLYRRARGNARAATLDVIRRLGIPLRDDLGTELHSIGNRSVRLLFVFATGEPGFDLLKRGGGSVVERLRNRGLLSIEFVDGADHTFTSRHTRERLADLLTRHVERCEAQN